MPLCQHSPANRPWHPVSDLNHRILHYDRVKALNRGQLSPQSRGLVRPAADAEFRGDPIAVAETPRSPAERLLMHQVVNSHIHRNNSPARSPASPASRPRANRNKSDSGAAAPVSPAHARPITSHKQHRGRSPGGRGAAVQDEDLQFGFKNEDEQQDPQLNLGPFMTPRTPPSVSPAHGHKRTTAHGTRQNHEGEMNSVVHLQSPITVKTRPNRPQFRSYDTKIAGVEDYADGRDGRNVDALDRFMQDKHNRDHHLHSDRDHYKNQFYTPGAGKGQSPTVVHRAGGACSSPTYGSHGNGYGPSSGSSPRSNRYIKSDNNYPTSWNPSAKVLHYGDYRNDLHNGLHKFEKKIPNGNKLLGPVRMMDGEERKLALQSVSGLYSHMIESGKRSFMSRDECAKAMEALSAKRIYVVEDDSDVLIGGVGGGGESNFSPNNKSSLSSPVNYGAGSMEEYSREVEPRRPFFHVVISIILNTLERAEDSLTSTA
ncbi:unnamed protein product [Amoebophrya sp. A120]|nr:unnamed protein product [Amoebophrya sp. A120]|eukprot:GSA120T00010729001.1